MGAGYAEAVTSNENALIKERVKSREIWGKELEAKARRKEKGGREKERGRHHHGVLETRGKAKDLECQE